VWGRIGTSFVGMGRMGKKPKKWEKTAEKTADMA
jgi:hypothetical protein